MKLLKVPLWSTLNISWTRFFFVATLLLSLHASAWPWTPPRPPSQRPALQQFVMMPLKPITDWDAFRQGVRTLKSLGVSGLTTDICWGLVEKSEGQFDWSYYKRLGEILKEEGMPWVTILSTHAIGGNVGDDVNIPIPEYVWSKVKGGEYVYQNGLHNRETISFFADEEPTMEILERFYRSFKKEIYEPNKDNIAKIYVGIGPASEARYPSYGENLGFPYPSEGGMPIYSPEALESFRNFLKARYHSVENLNKAWNLHFDAFTGVEKAPQMPKESTYDFLKNARGTTYYRDLMDWYSQALVMGTHRNLKAMAFAFNNNMNSQLGSLFAIKVAGLHWQRLNPSLPRGTELAAGYENYDPIFMVAREWKVGITFTCLEMQKRDDEAGYPRYSDPPGLVDQIVETSKRFQVPISGENALEFSDSKPLFTVRNVVESQNGESPFHGFTLLRWHLLVNADGSPTSLAHTYKNILVDARSYRLEYMSTLSNKELDDLQIGLFLVPVNSQTQAWNWEKRTPLRGRSDDSKLFFGRWDLIDPAAQSFAIGAIDLRNGAKIRLSMAQPLLAYQAPLNKIFMNPFIPPHLPYAELDPASQYGEISSLKNSLSVCENLLSRDHDKILTLIHEARARFARAHVGEQRLIMWKDDTKWWGKPGQ